MDKLFLKILDMSITACWCVLALLIVRLLLKKAPKKYVYALWTVVGFRLVCPVSFQSVLSLFNLTLSEAATTGLDAFGQIKQYLDVPVCASEGAVVFYPMDTVPAFEILDTYAPIQTVQIVQDIILILSIFWLTGISAMVIICIINYLRLRHRLRFAVRLEDNIWQCETVRSPFILGIIHPRIYLPYGLDKQTQNYILSHELHHLKRLDHVVKALSFAILTVHWFNPLCYLAFYLMNRDMEMSCDEYVLAYSGFSPTNYSRTLLSIASNKRFPAPSPLAFSETSVKQRIKNILNWKKPRRWVTVAAILTSVIVLISCAADPKKEITSTGSTEPYSAPFGAAYTATPFYTSPLISTIPSSESWKLGEDGSLRRYDTNQWTNLGQMTPDTLTADNFDIYFLDLGENEPYPATLRKNNKTAWSLYTDDSEVYFLLEQTNGFVFLVGGSYQPGKESCSLFVAYELLSADNLHKSTDSTDTTVPFEKESNNSLRSDDEQSLIIQALLGKRNEDLEADQYGTISYAVLQQTIACGSSKNPDIPAGYSVYELVVMYQRFAPANNGLGLTKTDIFPATVTVDNYPDGTYEVQECVISDEEIAVDDYFLPMMQGCYANAIAHYGLDTVPIIDDLMNQLTSSPAYASYPGAYIEEHQKEYDTLLYYGEYTLSYFFQRFANRGGAGLYGHIMALACEDIMAAMGEIFICEYANGIEWFHQFKIQALSLRDQGANLDDYPGSKLLLSILADPI